MFPASTDAERAERAERAAAAAPKPGGRLKRYLPLAAIAGGALAFFALGGGDYVSLQRLAENRDALQDWTAERPWLAGAGYVLAYILATAFSLPVGTVLTLAGGFVFGTLMGGALTVVGATIGAALVFLAARSAFADYFRDRLGDAVRTLRDKFAADAFSYILALRLAPVFPFVVVNVAPALAGVKLRDFVAATFLGIIPGTFVYASVGAGLDAIFAEGGEPDLQAIFKWEVVLPLALLALLALAPIVVKRIRRVRG